MELSTIASPYPMNYALDGQDPHYRDTIRQRQPVALIELDGMLSEEVLQGA